MGIPEPHEAGALGVLGEAGFEDHGTHLIGRPAGGAHETTSFLESERGATYQLGSAFGTPC